MSVWGPPSMCIKHKLCELYDHLREQSVDILKVKMEKKYYVSSSLCVSLSYLILIKIQIILVKDHEMVNY